MFYSANFEAIEVKGQLIQNEENACISICNSFLKEAKYKTGQIESCDLNPSETSCGRKHQNSDLKKQTF